MILVLFLSRSDVSYSFSSRTNKNPFLFLNTSIKFSISFASTELVFFSLSLEETSIDDTDKEVKELMLLSILNLFEIFKKRNGFLFVLEEKEYDTSLLDRN